MFLSFGFKGGLIFLSLIIVYFCYLVYINFDLIFRFGCVGEWEYVIFIFLI